MPKIHPDNMLHMYRSVSASVVVLKYCLLVTGSQINGLVINLGEILLSLFSVSAFEDSLFFQYHKRP